MRVVVTAEDIANGVRADPCRCPVALACRRAGVPGADATHRKIFYDYDKAIDAPIVATKFMKDFDAKRAVEPFEFELEMP